MMGERERKEVNKAVRLAIRRQSIAVKVKSSSRCVLVDRVSGGVKRKKEKKEGTEVLKISSR